MVALIKFWRRNLKVFAEPNPAEADVPAMSTDRKVQSPCMPVVPIECVNVGPAHVYAISPQQVVFNRPVVESHIKEVFKGVSPHTQNKTSLRTGHGQMSSSNIGLGMTHSNISGRHLGHSQEPAEFLGHSNLEERGQTKARMGRSQKDEWSSFEKDSLPSIAEYSTPDNANEVIAEAKRTVDFTQRVKADKEMKKKRTKVVCG